MNRKIEKVGQSEKEKEELPPIVVVAIVAMSGGGNHGLRISFESFGKEKGRFKSILEGREPV